MAESKHTPGPWWVEDRRAGSGLQVQAAHRGPGSSYCVATVHRWEAPEANARLISAAPDLLEALEALCVELNGVDRPWGNLRAAADKAEAAIAKATGAGQ